MGYKILRKKENLLAYFGNKVKCLLTKTINKVLYLNLV